MADSEDSYPVKLYDIRADRMVEVDRSKFVAGTRYEFMGDYWAPIYEHRLHGEQLGQNT